MIMNPHQFGNKSVMVYGVCQKRKPLRYKYIRNVLILTDLKKPFTGKFSGKLEIKPPLKIPHIHVATLPCDFFSQNLRCSQ